MKHQITIFLCSICCILLVSGCEDPDGEGTNVLVEASASPVFNAGPDGIEITTGAVDPESNEPVTISVSNGYFSFNLAITNNSTSDKGSIIIQEVKVEITDSKLNVRESLFTPGTFNLTQFYITHVDPAVDGDGDGNPDPAQFPYVMIISDLEEDDSGRFSYGVKVQLKGFFTGGRASTADPVQREQDIFELQGESFRKIVSFQVTN